MAKGANSHLNFHLDKTWEYVTGSGTDLTQWGYGTLNAGLPHDVLHVVYYPAIYVAAPMTILITICALIAAVSDQ